jgi:uncharacterized protein (TIGR02145 family)
VTVGAIPAPPTGGSASSTGGNTFTFSATPASGCTIDWYDSATGGIKVAPGASSYSTTISGTTSYYAESRNTTTGCVSSSRLEVTGVGIYSVSGCLSTPNFSNPITRADVAFASGTVHTYPKNADSLTVSPPVKIKVARAVSDFNGGTSGSYKADYADHPNGTDTYGSFFSWCMVVQYADVLCSDGWRVPTETDFEKYDGSGSSVAFSNLPGNHGWQTGGYVFKGTVTVVGSDGYYWSSSLSSSDYAYNAGISNNYFYSRITNTRNNGFLLRCVR